MGNLQKMHDGTYEAVAFGTFDEVIAEAKQLAAMESARERLADPSIRTLASYIVTFDFNGVTLHISGTSNLEHITRDWTRAMSGYLGDKPEVGPHPQPRLSSKELDSDARIEAANQARRDKEAAKRTSNAKAHRKRVEARMKNAPEMEFDGPQGKELWDSWVAANTDPMGAGIMAYAERWARMMQLEMSKGKSLTDIYDDTRMEADLEGMSGASGGFAQQMLVQAWKHGAELARARDEWRESVRSRFRD